MRVLLAVLLVAMVAPGAAAADPLPGAPSASISATGTEAVAWTVGDDLLPRIDGVQVALGSGGAFSAPVALDTGPLNRGYGFFRPQVWVAAQPAGGARVVWEAEADGGTALRTAFVSADGTVGPTRELTASAVHDPSVATGQRGDVLAAWSQTDGTVAVADPATGDAVTLAMPGLPHAALADDGTAIVAAAPDGGGVQIAVRAPGASFAAPVAVPGVDSVGAADVAEDGTVVIADLRGAVTVRRPKGTFGASVTAGTAPVRAAAAFTGGHALVASPAGAYDVADGAATSRTPSLSDTLLLAATEDGGATLASAGSVYARTGTGAFDAPFTVDQVAALAASDGGRLLLRRTATADGFTYDVDGREVVRYRALPAEALPPMARATIDARVTAVGRTALVPVRCDPCSGWIRAGHGPKSRLDRRLGVLARVRVPRRARRVRLTLFLQDPDAITRVHRRLHRGARPRFGCAPYGADVLATGDGNVLSRSVGDPVQTASVCGPQRRPLTLETGAPGDVSVIGAGAVDADWAVVAVSGLGHSGLNGATDLVRTNLATGVSTRIPLVPSSDVAYAVVRLAVSPAGTIAIAERVEDHVRIRLVTDAGDRVLDPGPGVDPASLRHGDGVFTWTRGGSRQQASDE